MGDDFDPSGRSVTVGGPYGSAAIHAGQVHEAKGDYTRERRMDSAKESGGVGPFTLRTVGSADSVPALPSLVASWQKRPHPPAPPPSTSDPSSRTVLPMGTGVQTDPDKGLVPDPSLLLAAAFVL